MPPFKINLLLISIVFFWASAFVGIRIGLDSYSPGSLALLRFFVASICMACIYGGLPKQQPIAWVDRLQLMLMGLVGIGVYNICLNYGELSISAGIASFVIGLMPVFTVLLSIVFLHERPRIWAYVGMVISLLGLILMVLAENTQASGHLGLLLILISACMGAVYTVLQKHFLRRYHPVAITAWVIWGGTLSFIVFFPTLWQEIRVAKIDATLAVVYLGIFPAALAYVGWSYVLQHMQASTAALSIYASPVISTLLGFVLLNEQPSMLALCGGVLSLLGALYATLSR